MHLCSRNLDGYGVTDTVMTLALVVAVVGLVWVFKPKPAPRNYFEVMMDEHARKHDLEMQAISERIAAARKKLTHHG